jgi:hypothetical protein
MKSKTKVRLAAGLTAGVMMLSITGSAFAAPNSANQSGGAAGVIAAVVQVNDTLNDLSVLSPGGDQNIEVVTVKDSLNNVLNNSPILSNNVITLQDFLNDNTVLTDFLNDNNILITDVVAVDVLSGGDIVIFVQ